jgi:hypothetical protein
MIRRLRRLALWCLPARRVRVPPHPAVWWSAESARSSREADSARS